MMDFTRLARFQDWLSDEWRIPGSSCVAYVDGKKVYEHSSGYADVERGIRMKGDELLNMFSITKVITSLAALQLLEKGLYHLNDGLDNYLPEFRNIKVAHILPNGECEIKKAERYMRVRDLFCMGSGYDYALDTEQIKRHKDENGNITAREMARALAETPLLFEPGEKWCYGLSHDILAAFVEVLSGEKFRDYVKKNIFDPVGMKDSYFHITPELEKRMAAQYRFNNEKGVAERIEYGNWAVISPEYDSGGAGLLSTVPDVAKLASVLAMGGITPEGERIVSERTVSLWHTNCLSDDVRRECLWDTLDGYGYGLGVRTHMDPSKSGSLSPIGEFGWTGAAGGFIMMDTETRSGLFYAHHMQNNQEYFTVPRLRNIFYSCL